MPHDAPTALRDFLTPDETILWSGRPRQGVFFVPEDRGKVLFGLTWLFGSLLLETIFATRCFGLAPRSADQPLFVAAGGFFVLIGLYLTVGRFFVESWPAGRLSTR